MCGYGAITGWVHPAKSSPTEVLDCSRSCRLSPHHDTVAAVRWKAGVVLCCWGLIVWLVNDGYRSTLK